MTYTEKQPEVTVEAEQYVPGEELPKHVCTEKNPKKCDDFKTGPHVHGAGGAHYLQPGDFIVDDGLHGIKVMTQAAFKAKYEGEFSDKLPETPAIGEGVIDNTVATTDPKTAGTSEAITANVPHGDDSHLPPEFDQDAHLNRGPAFGDKLVVPAGETHEG